MKKISVATYIPSVTINQTRPRHLYVSELPGERTCLPARRTLSASHAGVYVTAAGDGLEVSVADLPGWQLMTAYLLSCLQSLNKIGILGIKLQIWK